MKAEVWKLLSLILIIIFAFLSVSTVKAAGVIATITVGTSPTGVVYDSSTNEVFAANSGFNTVSVISDSSNSVVATITVGTSPTGLAFDSAKGEIFVANHGSDSVSVMSDSTNRVVATVPVGTNPNNLAYDSGKREIFVVNSGDNSVSVISDSSNAVLATIPVGTNPNKVIYDLDKGELFVCNSGYNTVSVISDSTNAVVATIRVGISPAGAAYDSGKGEVFVANYGSGVNTVSVISDTNYAVVATVPVGTTPYGVAYNSVTNEIYVSNHGSNSVSVISDSSNAVVATIPVGNTPAGITFDFGKGEMFVANMGDKTVSVISDATTVFTSPTPSNSVSPTPGATSTPNPSSIPLNSSDLTQQVWVPSPTNAVEAVTVTTIAVGVISLIFAALSNPLGNAGGKVGEKTKGLIPENIKNWLEEFVSSRRKLEIAGKTGSPFLPTKTEAIAYTTAIIVLAISFSYVKVITLNQMWVLLPVFFATSVLVGFVQKFFAIAFMRSRGVWSEHKIWPFGLVLFLFTTFVFRVPFSSPTRSVNQSSKFTERLGAIVSASGILISLAFAGIFFLLLKEGYVAIGGAGLDMCIIGSFFGTFPVSPMSGKDIFDHNKLLWAGLFMATLMIFAAWLLLI